MPTKLQKADPRVEAICSNADSVRTLNIDPFVEIRRNIDWFKKNGSTADLWNLHAYLDGQRYLLGEHILSLAKNDKRKRP